MGFDIGSLELHDTVELSILHPKTGVETGIKMQVASYSSDRLKSMSRAFANKQMQSRATKNTIEKSESHLIEMAVAAVVSWSGVEENGVALDCTPDNVRRFLKLHDSFYDQVFAAASDSAAFIKA